MSKQILQSGVRRSTVSLFTEIKRWSRVSRLKTKIQEKRKQIMNYINEVKPKSMAQKRRNVCL